MIVASLTPKPRQRFCASVLIFWVTFSAPGHAAPAPLPHLTHDAAEKAVVADPQKGREGLLPYIKPGAPVDPRDQMIAYTYIGLSYVEQQNYKKILQMSQAGLRIAQRLDDKKSLILNLSYMGLGNLYNNKLNEAVIQFKQSGEIAAEFNDINLWGQSLYFLSYTFFKYGNYIKSVNYSLEAEKVLTVYGQIPFDPAGYLQRTDAYIALNRISEAKNSLNSGIKEATKRGSLNNIPFILHKKEIEAKIHLKMNETGKARQAALTCLALQKRAHFSEDTNWGCRLVLASVEINMRNLESAELQISKIFSILNESDKLRGVTKLISFRDFHVLSKEFFQASGNKYKTSTENSIINELNSKISMEIEQSNAALYAEQLKITGKQLSLSLLQEANRNLVLQRRQIIIISFLLSILFFISGLAFFIWYRGKQLGLQQQQQHNERTRIARDLHDTMLHKAASAQMHLQATVMQAKRENEPLAERLGEIVEQMGIMMKSARAVVWHLRSPAVERGNLVEAINEWLVHARAEAIAKINSETIGENTSLTSDQTEETLRIAQEAVGNAIRHAQAKTITIGLVQGEDEVKLSVIDDGTGFEYNRQEQFDVSGSHFGLMGMAERARNLGGTLSIVSARGSGTKINLVFPV